MPITYDAEIELRGDTAANLTAANKTYKLNEPIYETDTGKLKVGDGVTAWNSLGYFSAGGGGTVATGAEVNTGTNNTKFASPLAIADSNIWRPEESAQISGLTDKATPVDADTLVIDDSAASNVKKKLTWANLKATLKTYFDTLYGSTTLRKGTGTDIAGAVTINNAEECIITTVATAILSGAIYQVTLTSNIITSGSNFVYGLANGGNTQGLPIIQSVKYTSGTSCLITILNISGQSTSDDTNGTLVLSILILN